MTSSPKEVAQRNGGRVAFPLSDRNGPYSGMTKREVIAASALQGFVAATDEDGEPIKTPEKAAALAVAYADALLLALEDPPR